MKVIASLFLSIALCGVASAAPLAIDSTGETHKAMSSEIIGAVETGNIHGTSSIAARSGTTTPPPVEVIPEPASMALLGIGLGLAALRRRRS